MDEFLTQLVTKLHELKVYNEIVTSDKYSLSPSDVELVNKKEVLELVEEVAAECKNDWILVEERLPESNIDVEVTLANGKRHVCWYSELNQKWIDTLSNVIWDAEVIAWKEPSEPYKSRESEA